MITACVAITSPHQVMAWGATGHRIIGRLAVEALPSDLPSFVRTSAAIEAVGELAREPDRWKDAGRMHDADRDPAHFLDLGDDGKVLGGPALAGLPGTREGFDSDLRAVGADSWRAGYLPYSIIDGWQQLSKDFAYWRAEQAAVANLGAGPHRSWLADDAVRRESLIIRDLGVLAHYVGDGSQPLHVTAHFKGWGPGSNPQGFTQDRIHAMFEGALVRRYMDEAEVRARMAPYRDCHCLVGQRTAAFLAATSAQVVPLYRLQQLGAFVGGDARGRAFTAARLAAGAGELRDMVIDAWRASASGEVGYPAVRVADVVAGKIDPYDSLYGLD